MNNEHSWRRATYAMYVILDKMSKSCWYSAFGCAFVHLLCDCNLKSRHNILRIKRNFNFSSCQKHIFHYDSLLECRPLCQFDKQTKICRPVQKSSPIRQWFMFIFSAEKKKKERRMKWNKQMLDEKHNGFHSGFENHFSKTVFCTVWMLLWLLQRRRQPQHRLQLSAHISNNMKWM